MEKFTLNKEKNIIALTKLQDKNDVEKRTNYMHAWAVMSTDVFMADNKNLKKLSFFKIAGEGEPTDIFLNVDSRKKFN